MVVHPTVVHAVAGKRCNSICSRETTTSSLVQYNNKDTLLSRLRDYIVKPRSIKI